MDNSYLFRAWNKKTDEMYYQGSNATQPNGIMECEFVFGNTLESGCWIRNHGGQFEKVPDEDVIIMRSTGLLAAKSYRGDGEMERLVFEGDVVRRKADVYKLGERAPVGIRIVVGTVIWDDHWKKEAGGWAVSAHDEHGNPTNYSLMSDFEIIGTIHDPEGVLIFGNMSDEARKKIYNVLDASIDVFLEKMASGEYDEDVDD